ncbi:MAG: hypothetical protein AAF762_05335 [Pseudomonadota bacterium]
MMRLLGLLVLLCLAACGRPLTPSEAAFAEDLFGDTLDVSKARIALVPGIVPPERKLAEEATVLVGTERACLRERRTRSERPPPSAFALWNMMQFDVALYASDMALQYPDRVRFPTTLILAHELTHVWQWQNRDRTGYSPWRAAWESFRFADPYFWESGEEAAFFAFEFEQQAAIVTDFVCFTTSNPDHPRRAELRELLLPVFPVEDFERAIRGE